MYYLIPLLLSLGTLPLSHLKRSILNKTINQSLQSSKRQLQRALYCKSVFLALCYLLDVAAAVAACRSFSTFEFDFFIMEWDWHQFFFIFWFSIIWHACFCFSVFLNSEFFDRPACQLPPCAVLHIVLPFCPPCFSNWKYKSCVFFFWGVCIMCFHLRMVIV